MTEVKQETETTKDLMKPKKGFVSGTGRRKTAVAGVFLYQKKGDILVNGVSINDYFSSKRAELAWQEPFYLIGVSHPEKKFSATIKVSGSGKSAQLDAVILGLARALAKVSEENSDILHKNGMLTRDSRMVERKKYWLRKARKAPQYSKR